MKYALLASILLFIACQKKESTAPPSLQIQPLADTPTSKSAYELGQVSNPVPFYTSNTPTHFFTLQNGFLFLNT
ncbi:MAG: hypothetical protein DI538_00360 [Azospira oryzae]|nr:MAG: hypothetical protein DI538_00360 [Azospira oryzae]